MLKRLYLSFTIFTLLLLAAYYFAPMPVQHSDTRYLKVTHQGDVLTPWQGPWACVFDTQTKLLWEVKRDDESIHDGYWSYSWFDGSKGHQNAGDCYFEKDRCDTQDLIRRANQTQLCQVSGWRLPSEQEFKTIFKQQDRPKQPQLATDYFRHIKAGDYWTKDAEKPLSGHFRQFGKGAVAVDFYQGRFHSLPYRNAAFVMLVTSQQPHQVGEVSAYYK